MLGLQPNENVLSGFSYLSRVSIWDGAIHLLRVLALSACSPSSSTPIEVDRVLPSPLGVELALIGEQGSVSLLDLHSGRVRLQTRAGLGTELVGCAWSPEGTRLALLSTDGSMEILRPADGVSVAVLNTQVCEKVRAFDFVGEFLIVVGCESSGADVWSIEERRRVATHTMPRRLTALAISPGGQRLALGDDTGHVRVVQTRAKDLAFELKVEGYVSDLDFHPEGSSLAIASGNEVRLWTFGAADESRVLPHLGPFGERWDFLSDVTHSPDGSILVVTSPQGVCAWDVTTSRRLWRYDNEIGGAVPWRAQFSPDGTRVGIDPLGIHLHSSNGGLCHALLPGTVFGRGDVAWTASPGKLQVVSTGGRYGVLADVAVR